MDMTKRALPAHIGFIPDGNRRWALRHGLAREEGYASGIAPGIRLFELCRRRGIQEMTVFGFTQDNTKRPAVQIERFRSACVEFATEVARRGAALLAVGQIASSFFPDELREFQTRQGAGMKVNLLVNYHWEWDIAGLERGRVRSWQIPRLDLIVRWGGGRRLSGFLPVQSVYADFFVVDDFWPDFRPEHFDSALAWFKDQDRTLGG
jgi:undecaprenyl diphosphate synthase